MRKVMRVLRKSSSSSESGAAAVEFAIVVPVLLLLLFAIFDYGRFFLVQMALTSGAQEGVRASVLGRDSNYVIASALTPITEEVVSVAVLGEVATCSTAPSTFQSCVSRSASICSMIPAGNPTTVSLSLSFTWITTGALWFFIAPNQPQTVSATATAKCND